MQLFLINNRIDQIKGTFYRQVMFAEFEKLAHERAEQMQALTVDSYRELYLGLLEKYFGPAVEFEDEISLECFRIPHFYSPFYVYKYATGIAAAEMLASQVLSDNTKALERYMNFLKSGGSKLPLELLRDAGADLTTDEPINRTLEIFSNLVDQLEEKLDL